MKFRTLKANEVDVRVQSVKEKGAILLLFKDARVDQRILDESTEVGPMNWTRDHKELKGVIYCGVSIWDKDKNIWVTKWDAGAESNTEKQKGEASDSFKRACFNWGIGRELYTSPFIWVKAENIDIKKNGNIFKTFDKFEVEKITYKDGSIDGLAIRNSKTGKRVFVQNPSKQG